VNEPQPPALLRFSRPIYLPQPPGGARVVLSSEERVPPERYDWDGLNRSSLSNRPVLLFQYTLSGGGFFQQGGKVEWIAPGSGFLALIPSAHRYWLPPEGEPWHFLWMTTDHPFMVERLGRLAHQYGNTLQLPETAPPIALFLRMMEQNTTNPYRVEADALRWTLELEQAVVEGSRGEDHFLGSVRSLVFRHLAEPFGVSELAAWCGMSRTHFSHRFKQASGMTPSEYIRELRLEAAAEHLREERLPLKAIAAATGFADANHLCKAFRRRFAVSPGTYRRQLPGALAPQDHSFPA